MLLQLCYWFHYFHLSPSTGLGFPHSLLFSHRLWTPWLQVPVSKGKTTYYSYARQCVLVTCICFLSIILNRLSLPTLFVAVAMIVFIFFFYSDFLLTSLSLSVLPLTSFKSIQFLYLFSFLWLFLLYPPPLFFCPLLLRLLSPALYFPTSALFLHTVLFSLCVALLS